MTRYQATGSGLGSAPPTQVRLSPANRAWLARYCAATQVSLNAAMNEAVAVLRRTRGEPTGDPD